MSNTRMASIRSEMVRHGFTIVDYSDESDLASNSSGPACHHCHPQLLFV
jgi:hypothetical protein